MIQVLKRATSLLEQGQAVTLVTVVTTQGSTPRRPGAVMLVGAHGLEVGTIGGGLLEHRCTEIALQHLGEGTGFTQQFILDNQQAGGLGMICGGTTQVLFTPLHRTNPLSSENATAHYALYLPLDGTEPRLGTAVTHPHILEGELVIPLRPRGRIFLMGGGHVSLETARLLTWLDFPYVVVDDRGEFSNATRFPGADATLVTPYDQLAQVLTGKFTPTAEDAICVMTRGHMGDTECVRYALGTPLGYIGVMGSRSKGAKMLTQLEEEGFSTPRQRITTPIGLPIGGQTPAELAVSIVAQLIQWRTS